MTSSFTLLGGESYRIVGKHSNHKIYRLPYIDKAGRQQPLKLISKTKCGGSIGWNLEIDGRMAFRSETAVKSLLIKCDKMELNFREKGMPF
jgi:hypothetical protein